MFRLATAVLALVITLTPGIASAGDTSGKEARPVAASTGKHKHHGGLKRTHTHRHRNGGGRKTGRKEARRAMRRHHRREGKHVGHRSPAQK